MELLPELVKLGIGGFFGGVFLWLYMRANARCKEYIDRIIKLTADNYKITKALEDLAATIRNSTERKDPTLTQVLQNTEKLCKDSDIEQEVRHRMQSVPYVKALKGDDDES